MSAIIRRRLLKNRGTKLYFYGKELVTWTAVDYYNGSYVNFGIFTKQPRTLRYQETSSGGSREGWYKKGWASPKIDVTNAQAMVVVFDNDFTIPTLGAYPSMIGFAALSSLTDTSSSNNISTQVAEEIFNFGTEIKAGKPYRLDLTGVTGEVYLTVYFGIRGSGKSYTVNISEIYLEEIGEATDDTLPADFYDNGVLPIMPEADKELKSLGPSDIISFPDGDGLSLETLKAYVEPVQDLHGYASPWPAGGGKNKLIPLSAGTTTVSGVTYTKNADGTISFAAGGTASAAIAINIMDAQDLPTGTYIMSGCPSGGSEESYKLNWAYHGANDYGSSVTASHTNGTSGIVRIQIANGYTIPTGGLLFKPMVCLSTATDPTTFAPYSNECPITGHTGVEIAATGRNLLDIGSSLSDWWFTVQNGTRIGSATTSITSVASGSVDPTTGSITITSYNTSGYRWGAKELFLKKNTDYKVLVAGFKVCGFNSLADGTWGDTLLTNAGTFNTGDYEHIVISFYPENFSKSGIMVLMDGDTGTAYSPYSGEVVPVTFGAIGDNIGDVTYEQGTMLTPTAGSTYANNKQASTTRLRNSALIYAQAGATITFNFNSESYDAGVQPYDNNGLGVVPSSPYNEWHTEPFSFVSTGAFAIFLRKKDNTTITTDELPSIDIDIKANVLYKGYLNVTTGELVATHKGVDMGAQTWYATDIRFYFLIPDAPDWPAYDVRRMPLMCSTYRVITDGAGTSDNAVVYNGWWPNDHATQIVIIQDNRFTNVSQVAPALAGQYVVYPLATPLTFQLDPNTIRSLIGDTNVWNSAGQTELSYYGI